MMRPENILIIDDSSTDRFITKHFLQGLDSCGELIEANNGLEALKIYNDDQQKSEDEQISLILLDINMPLMNGFEFLENLKKVNTSHRNVHVIMLSYSVMNEDRRKAAEFKEVVSYIEKPLNQEKVLEMVDRLSA